MTTPVILWGASGHARVVADILRLSGYTPVGCLDDTGASGPERSVDGIPMLGGRERIPGLIAAGTRHVALAFGQCVARLAVFRELPQLGLTCVTAIHPSAVVAGTAEVGSGTVVCASAVINPGARLGPACIVNTSASVDHDCMLHAAVHVAPGAHLAAWVEVGEAAWIGVGASVSDRLRIGARTIIGAGAVVVSDIPADVVAYGCPAKPARNR